MSEALRKEVRDWMAAHLTGRFAPLWMRAGAGEGDVMPELRKEWERELAAGRWTCLGWPEAHGGRALSVAEQVVFQEEYARAGGPGRMGHIGEGLSVDLQARDICRPNGRRDFGQHFS